VSRLWTPQTLRSALFHQRIADKLKKALPLLSWYGSCTQLRVRTQQLRSIPGKAGKVGNALPNQGNQGLRCLVFHVCLGRASVWLWGYLRVAAELSPR
jgi:hypothetical protein